MSVARRARPSVVCIGLMLFMMGRTLTASAAEQEATPSQQHEETGGLIETEPIRREGRLTRSILFGVYATLSAADLYLTARALDRGAQELNPVLRPISRTPFALAAVKIGAGGATLIASQRLARRHPRVATLTLVGMNVAYAAIVFHNGQVLMQYGF